MPDLNDVHRPLSTYALPTRLRKALAYGGCRTLYDVLQLTPFGLTRFKNAGLKTLQDLLDFFATGLTVQELKRTKRMYTTFREILGVSVEGEVEGEVAEQPKKKLTPVMVKAACGHEYKTSVLHSDEEDFRAQRATLARLPCLECIERTQAPHGQVVPFRRDSESSAA